MAAVLETLEVVTADVKASRDLAAKRRYRAAASAGGIAMIPRHLSGHDVGKRVSTSIAFQQTAAKGDPTLPTPSALPRPRWFLWIRIGRRRRCESNPHPQWCVNTGSPRPGFDLQRKSHPGLSLCAPTDMIACAGHVLWSGLEPARPWAPLEGQIHEPRLCAFLNSSPPWSLSQARRKRLHLSWQA